MHSDEAQARGEKEPHVSIADQAKWLAAVKDSLFAFVSTRVIIFVVFTAAAIIPAKNSNEITLTWPDIDGILSQGDAAWYLDLATNGYDPGPYSGETQANWAFFPLYPMAVRFLMELGAGSATAGIILSNLFSLAALTFLWKLTQEVSDEATARRTVFYLCAFPTSIFLSGTFNMGLALLLLVASLYLLIKQRWAASSIVAGLATLARGQAVLILASLAWAALTTRADWHERLKLTPYFLLVVTPLAGFLLYMERHTGNAFAPWDMQAVWGREVDVPGRVIGSFLLHPRIVGQATSPWDFTAANVAVAVASVVMLPFVFLRFGGIIGWYTAATVLATLPYSTLQAVDRYVLLAFPLFMLLGVWGAREWADKLTLVTFLTLLGFWAALFANGYQPVLA